MTFVVSDGAVRALDRAPYGASAPRGIELSPSMVLTIEQLWRAQPALRTTVGFLARNVAQLPLDVFDRVSATDRMKVHDHPAARLLDDPYPGSTWTKYRLLNTLMHDLCLFDEAFWLKLRLANGARALMPVPRRMISVKAGTWWQTEQYELVGPRGRMPVDADRVIHFHGYNPDDPRTGVPPVETLRQILAEEYAASRYREQMWRNGARISGYIQRPPGRDWGSEARDRFREGWRAQYSGDGPETGGTPVLEDGMEFKAAAVSPREAQYVEARKLTREEVAVAYHVSPVMLGLMDGATFSNVTELHKMLYQDTLAPWLVQIAQDLERQLVEDVDPDGADRLYVEFNLNEKLRGSFEERAAAMSRAVGRPWRSPNEARALDNLPSIAGGDELTIPLNVAIGGLASPADTAPNEPDNGPSNGQPPKSVAAVIGAVRARQEHVLLSRLGAAKDTDPGAADLFDADRWNRDLARQLKAVGVPDPGAVAAVVNGSTGHALQAAFDDDGDLAAAVRRVFAAPILEEIAA